MLCGWPPSRPCSNAGAATASLFRRRRHSRWPGRSGCVVALSLGFWRDPRQVDRDGRSRRRLAPGSFPQGASGNGKVIAPGVGRRRRLSALGLLIMGLFLVLPSFASQSFRNRVARPCKDTDAASGHIHNAIVFCARPWPVLVLGMGTLTLLTFAWGFYLLGSYSRTISSGVARTFRFEFLPRDAVPRPT